MAGLVVRRVPVLSGWRWISGGFFLFWRAPAVWMLLFSVYVALSLFLNLGIPVIGSLVVNIAGPFILAGFMQNCRALEEGRGMDMESFSAPFREYASQYLGVAAYFLFGLVIISVAAQIMGGQDMQRLAEAYSSQGAEVSDEQMVELARELLPVVGLVALLHLPLMMGYWLAPALVRFDRVMGVEAVLLSFRASLANLLPLLLYTLLLGLLGVLALLTFGFAFLVLGPVIIASVYAAYRDIFRAAGPENAAAEA